MKRISNALVLLVIAAAVVTLLTIWLRPQPARVDVAKAWRGPMRVTLAGEGKTRVTDRFVVAAPVAGRLRRITLRRGDVVVEGQVIAQIEPLPLSPLDPRQRAEAIARVNAAEAAKRESDALLNESKASYDQARRDLERSEILARSGDIPRQELERAQTMVTTSLREYEAARSRSERAAYEVKVARSALLAANQRQSSAAATIKIRAPTSGRVLRILEESERVIVAGAFLLEISNPSKLEVVIELLSRDAVKVNSGALVLIEDWGGKDPLQARVRLVEPSAFTKISALGIEEQRVNVIADLTEASPTLGDGYRVTGRIIIWEAEHVLQVPVSAIFRRGEGWSLFVVDNGVATLRDVEFGQRTPFEAEIKSGLEEGAEVITHPSSQIEDGIRVQAQSD